jgi:hypothetical protein
VLRLEREAHAQAVRIRYLTMHTAKPSIDMGHCELGTTMCWLLMIEGGFGDTSLDDVLPQQMLAI